MSKSVLPAAASGFNGAANFAVVHSGCVALEEQQEYRCNQGGNEKRQKKPSERALTATAGSNAHDNAKNYPEWY